MRGRLTLAIAAALLGGCHGASPDALPSRDVPQVQARGGSGTLVIALPAIVPAWPTPAPGASGPLLSSGTRTVSGTFGSSAFGPVSLTARTSHCSLTTDGLHCTIQVKVSAIVMLF